MNNFIKQSKEFLSEGNYLRFQILILTKEFGNEFALISAKEKTNLFEELKVDKMNEDLYSYCIFAVASSLRFPWKKDEDYSEFFEKFFYMYTGKIPDFEKWGNRNKAIFGNYDLVLQQLENIEKNGKFPEWKGFWNRLTNVNFIIDAD